MALPQPDRISGDVAPAYVRHKPKQTPPYQLVEQYWPEFQTQLSETGHFLPRPVTREFEDYLRAVGLIPMIILSCDRAP